MDYNALPVPQACYADFCLIPVGTNKVSVADEIAQVQRVLQASGLKYTLHSAGTTVDKAQTAEDKVKRVQDLLKPST
ncbi:hypothetical protein E4U60_002023 [Claviceps pazoutovae]|uniref:Thiamine-binding protein domain-containing protein n=1 Tax=Claviceps pazoutovae TaxID=1649127 RepID=A0A9P7MJC8_9HYPO|nr:hypothetical protein E4U60_002023 [Claviceps pazoutovae]